MKKKLYCHLVAAAFLAGNGVALADTSVKTDQASSTQSALTQQQIEKLTAETKMLEKELTALKTQLNKQTSNTVYRTAINKKHSNFASSSKATKKDLISTTHKDKIEEQIERILNTTRYAHGLAVVTSPFVGKSYSPFDLITNISSANTDLLLLKQRKSLDDFATSHNEIIPDRPVVDLSGAIEGKVTYSDGYEKSNGVSQTDFNLNRVELDAIGEIGPWATGAIMINYEDKTPHAGTTDSPNFRISNSRLKIDRAFLTIGNLNKSPVYLTAGQFTVPFGTFSSYLLADSLPKLLGRVKARAVELGYLKNGFNASAYAFKGDSYVNNSGVINNWGVNLDYLFHPFNYFNVLRSFNLATDVGVSYLANLADAKNLQETVYGLAQNTTLVPAGPANTEQLGHRVPALDGHLSLDLYPFHVFSEFVTATKAFDVTDMSFNNVGARPSALTIEATYNFPIFQQKYAFTLGYNRSWQALAVELPKQRYAAALSTSFWPYTVETLEYYRDVNYNYGDVGGTNHRIADQSASGTRISNVATLQIGVYF